MVTQVMEQFDFERVHNIMQYLNWKWAIGNGEMAVPNSYRIMKCADRLLRGVAQHYGDDEFHSRGTGGFVASLDSECLTLQFILTETTIDSDDYKED